MGSPFGQEWMDRAVLRVGRTSLHASKLLYFKAMTDSPVTDGGKV